MHCDKCDEPTTIFTCVLRLGICAPVCEIESRAVDRTDFSACDPLSRRLENLVADPSLCFMGEKTRSALRRKTKINGDLALFPTSINILFHITASTTKFVSARMGWQLFDYRAACLIPGMVASSGLSFSIPKSRKHAFVKKLCLVSPGHTPGVSQRHDP